MAQEIHHFLPNWDLDDCDDDEITDDRGPAKLHDSTVILGTPHFLPRSLEISRIMDQLEEQFAHLM